MFLSLSVMAYAPRLPVSYRPPPRRRPTGSVSREGGEIACRDLLRTARTYLRLTGSAGGFLFSPVCVFQTET